MALSSAPQSFENTASLTITNQFDELGRVPIWLEQTGKRFGLSERTLFKLDMILSEALPNIISYAYLDQKNRKILIKLTDKSDSVVLEIVDDGIAFDPFATGEYQRPPSLESASIDGRGIHLIKSFTDTQEYQRIDHFNVMRVCILKVAKVNNTTLTISA